MSRSRSRLPRLGHRIGVPTNRPAGTVQRAARRKRAPPTDAERAAIGLLPAVILVAATVGYYAILTIAWLIARIMRCARWLLRDDR